VVRAVLDTSAAGMGVVVAVLEGRTTSHYMAEVVPLPVMGRYNNEIKVSK
jgi:hypothetical protein